MGKPTTTGVAETTTTAPAKTEAKRKMLTPEQRVAKLEADLAAARKKAEAKTNKAKAEATEKRAKLVAKRDALNVQILELTETIGDVDRFHIGTPADEAKAS